MKLLKIGFASLLLSCSLIADYVNTKDYNIFFNTTKNVDLNGAEIKEVFFGTRDKYLERDGVSGGDVATAVVAAPYVILTGVMTAGFSTYIQYQQYKELEATKPIYYYYVVNIKDKNGVQAKGVAMFLSREPKYKEATETELKEIYELSKGVFIK